MTGISLLACASDGSVEQWDGAPPVKGIMLRWLYDLSALGFPQYGFDVARATIPDAYTADWFTIAAIAAAKPSYDAGNFVVADPQGLAFSTQAGHTTLVVSTGDTVTVTFPNGAWGLDVTLARGVAGQQLTVTLLSGGTVVQTAVVDPATGVQLRTRGFDTVQLTGHAYIDLFRYHLLYSTLNWIDDVHLCVPVTNPNYPCRPTATNADDVEAESRLPHGVDWATRYKPGFAMLHAVLASMVAGTAMPPYQPSSTTDPTLSLDPVQLLSLSMFDPHLARIVGVAHDYTDAAARSTTTYAYKVTGSWRGAVHHLASPSGLAGLRAAATVTSQNHPAAVASGAWSVNLTAGPMTLHFTDPMAEMRLTATVTGSATTATWKLLDAQSNVLDGGPVTAHQIHSVAVGAATLELSGHGTVVVHQLDMTTVVRRTDIVPGIGQPTPPARDVAPPGPTTLTAVQESFAGETGGPGAAGQAVDTAPAGSASIDLTWDASVLTGQPFDEAASLTYQLAARALSTASTGTTPPTPTGPTRADLIAPLTQIMISSDQAASLPEWTDVATAGWHAYWVRGIDIFGQASAFSQPATVLVADTRLPSPPDAVRASWVATGQPGPSAIPYNLASMAATWQSANPTAEALATGWSWTPALAASCPDVDEFQVYMRLPTIDASGDASYANVAWGSPVAVLPVSDPAPQGTVQTSTSSIGTVRITQVVPIDSQTCQVTIGLPIEGGGGLMAGVQLVQGGDEWPIVDNGSGASPWLLVDISGGTSSPSTGSATLHGFMGRVFTLTVSMTPTPLTLGAERFGGSITDGTSSWTVLWRDANTFTCAWPRPTPLPAPPPAAGTTVTWCPSYGIVTLDTGFGAGLRAAAQPVGQAQVAVTAVRVTQQESSPSLPAQVTYVDVTPPPQPVLAPITPGVCCAPLATPADWYGRSYFTLSWSGQSGTGYLVQRALSSAVARLDFAFRWQGVASFPVTDLTWPAGLAGPSSASTLASDISGLSAALASAIANVPNIAAIFANLPSATTAPVKRANQALAALPPDAQGRVLAAYDALHSDALQLIANGPAASAAYTTLTPTPLPGAAAMTYTDEIPGRSAARWFYQVVARSSAGVTTTSPPPPPICAPDVVAPAMPVLMSALAVGTEPGISLRWPKAPDADLLRYRLYRTADAAATGNVADMAQVALLALPGATVAAGDVATTVDSTFANWIDYVDAADEGIWWYRLVAEDTSGNLSVASAPVKGRSVSPPPQPPVWLAGSPSVSGSTVTLAWSGDQARRACRVDRRTPGAPWQTVADWLPRGQFSWQDTIPDPTREWDYRITARDNAGRLSAASTVGVVPAQPMAP